MKHRWSRRNFLQSTSWWLTLAALPALEHRVYAAAPQPQLGEPRPFSFEKLVAQARALAAEAHVPQPRPAPELVHAIDYNVHEAIHYRPQAALFPSSPYPITFRHLGRLFPSQVKMYALQNGVAREVLYDPDLFRIPKGSIARKLPSDAGFAGLALQEPGKFDPKEKGWLYFLGASYFRGIGEDIEQGISARGVAVNTSPPGHEEFPPYSAFYIEPALKLGDPVTLYALLDGPSLSGAYRFVCHRSKAVVMDVDCRLFLRKDVAQLGIAPLTSMFWYGEYGRQAGVDWRPEVHDSDGLAIWTGKGRRLFRALENPTQFATSSFEDHNPKGFGLVQRDRLQQHYLDKVYYERRPSLWVEPLEPFGRGSIKLIEIPTIDEYHDNIVAFWVSDRPTKKGDALGYRYRLHWRSEQPFPSQLGRVIATRTGRGGEPATVEPKGVTKYVVEFAGPALEGVSDPERVRAKLSVSQGKIVARKLVTVPGTRHFLVMMDVKPERTGSLQLEATLMAGSKALSETWIYRTDVGR